MPWLLFLGIYALGVDMTCFLFQTCKTGICNSGTFYADVYNSLSTPQTTRRTSEGEERTLPKASVQTSLAVVYAKALKVLNLW